jgi:hypothetical protein
LSIAHPNVRAASLLCRALTACLLRRLLLQALLYGTPLAATDADGNKCEINGISNPDNLHYTNGILFIAEDTSDHVNNVVWAYDIETSECQQASGTAASSVAALTPSPTCVEHSERRRRQASCCCSRGSILVVIASPLLLVHVGRARASLMVALNVDAVLCYGLLALLQPRNAASQHCCSHAILPLEHCCSHVMLPLGTAAAT